MNGRIIRGTERLWQSLERLYDEALMDRIPTYIQPELYHYTTVDGLRGIVGSNTLQATSAYYLNDSSEIEYGRQIVASVTDEWLQLNSDNSSLPLRVFRLLAHLLGKRGSILTRIIPIYVSCFCKNGNLLSQWRAYGQSGGYSLGMLSTDLESRVRASGNFETRLIKVTYDQHLQRLRIHSILKHFVEHVERADCNIATDQKIAQDTLLWQLVEFLNDLILDEIVAFKNPAFEQEEEWRLVAKPRLSRTLSPSLSPAPGDSSVKYRTRRGVLVPFIELRPEEGDRLPILSIRYGPSLDELRTELALEGFLSQCGYPRVRIFGCDMPVIL